MPRGRPRTNPNSPSTTAPKALSFFSPQVLHQLKVLKMTI